MLGLSQCNKQESPVQAGEKQYIEVTASNGNDGSKVNVDFLPSVMNLTWEEGDEITVSGGAEGTLTLDDGAGTGRGHFSGEIEKKNDNELVFSYKKAAQERGDENPNLPDFNAQDGTETWIENTLYLETKAAYNDNGKYSLLMEIPYAVLKLDLSSLVATQNDVTVKDGYAIVATVKNLAKADAGEVFVALPAATEKTYMFGSNSIVVYKTWALANSTYYTAEGGNSIVVKPMFSVSGTTTVEFAPGNLYYDGSSWNFEATQWDYRTYAGRSAFITGSSSITTITPSANWGLFGWSGAIVANWGKSTSTSNSSYSGDFLDWGGNAIGSDAANTWRTLTDVEWGFLLGTSNPCRANASSLCGWMTLTDINVSGLVILPDGTENPSTVLDAITSTDALATCCAVFIPASGSRYGTDVNVDNTRGVCWASTSDNSGMAYGMQFTSGNVNIPQHNRRAGHSVRLVR